MNDQILMDNYLLLLKSTIEVYVHGTLESSNADIRSVLNTGLDETLSHQERTYNEMTKCGWYTVSNVKSSQIKQAIKTIENAN